MIIRCRQYATLAYDGSTENHIGRQTGIDRMALEVARDLGFHTGGTAPKDFMTETGPDKSLQDFGLVEYYLPGYPPRTEQNVIDGDATLIYGNDQSSGTMLTIKLCKKHHKPYIVNPGVTECLQFLHMHQVKVLNVAGNRRSQLLDGQLQFYSDQLTEVLKTL